MKPTLYLINSFDSTKGATIKFSWLGNMPIANTLRIRDNATNTVVYEVTQNAMRLEHKIPANSNIKNGTLYNASVRVTDSNNSNSEWSDVSLFYCFTAPTFSINIVPGQVIKAQTYGVDITYGQSEGELLQSYRVIVYNSNNAVVYDSNIRYILDTVRITNLQDNSDYYIIATGTTINGMNVTTGQIDFSVDFIKSEAYFICELQNMYETGGIYIKSNIVSVEGYADKDVIYIDNDIADLTDNVVHFDEGFSIGKDFALMIKGKNFKPNSQIARLLGQSETINIYYKYDAHADRYYFELNAIYDSQTYMLTTLSPSIDAELCLWIRRQGSLLQMEVVI